MSWERVTLLYCFIADSVVALLNLLTGLLQERLYNSLHSFLNPAELAVIILLAPAKTAETWGERQMPAGTPCLLGGAQIFL